MIMSSLVRCQRSPFEETCHFFRPSKKAQTPIMPLLDRRFGEHMGEVRNVSDSEFNDTVNGTEWVIVDFWAPWCAPCKAIGPVLEAVAEERELLVAKVDTEQNTATAAQLGVRSIPALFMYRNGTIVSQRTGSMPKAKLLSWIDEVMTADDF
jgi:thioredoxin 1